MREAGQQGGQRRGLDIEQHLEAEENYSCCFRGGFSLAQYQSSYTFSEDIQLLIRLSPLLIEEKNNINENSIFSREVAVTRQRRGDRRTERESTPQEDREERRSSLSCLSGPLIEKKVTEPSRHRKGGEEERRREMFGGGGAVLWWISSGLTN